MAKLIAVGIVIDKSTASRIVAEMTAMGGVWGEVFDIWHRSHYVYLTLLAHTKRRLRLGAPLVFMSADDAALRSALMQACDQLDDLRCRWTLFIEKGSAAEQIVRQELLIDSTVEGNA